MTQDSSTGLSADQIRAIAKGYNIKSLRDQPDAVKAGLKAKAAGADIDALLELDKERRSVLTSIDELRSQRNAGDNEFKKLLAGPKGPETEKKKKDLIAGMTKLAKEIDALEPRLKELESKIDEILITIPNIPHASVPVGGPQKNETVREWGEAKKFAFKPKTHIDIAEALDIIDFKRAAKLSGSNFILYKNEGARLERALYNFMLDTHTAKHGYQEVFPPFLVNPLSMASTGQLPKMKEDMYDLGGDGLYLIPTAEVPVTNIHRDEMLAEADLPICYAAYTACFRREAGSYGKDTRGLMRVHQFDKVELVKIVKPEASYDELEKLLANAETILQMLGLPYRVLVLASGDLSFAASKCYDLEAHAAGIDRWLEVSSCSNFEDFQARRANIRFKRLETKKPEFVHTLNGSGLALARTMAAILENYQTAEGSVVIPEVLRPYMGGMDTIASKT